MLLAAGRQNLWRDIVPGIIIGISQIEKDLDSLISGKIHLTTYYDSLTDRQFKIGRF